MNIFDSCQKVNDLLSSKEESLAREELIKIINSNHSERDQYSSLINFLTRKVGLYPYLNDASSWEEKFICETFKVDIGEKEPVTLHREQAAILNELLEGKNLAVSAPTSFGKSFIIDAFISSKEPYNVAIIVPTIALMDETRRRLQNKFGRKYKIITTSEAKLSERNILIFPQERAINYASKLNSLDILIVDEFYKASPKYDNQRSVSLLKAIAKLGAKAKQKYFLAPNISSLNDNLFTKGMQFLSIDFSTVYLERHNLYEKIGNDKNLKNEVLLNLLDEIDGKTLVYAGTYADIYRVKDIALRTSCVHESTLLDSFSEWLIENYSSLGDWDLIQLVKRGVGIHNGSLHRSLGQLQIKLFEENDGLNTIVSTSSIVEGINTSAKNVVVWRNKNGNHNLNDFTFRNIIGRGGRMFKYFVGDIYILEKPPEAEQNQLELEVPDALLDGSIEKGYERELTPDQLTKIIAYKEEMNLLLGEGVFVGLQEKGAFQNSDSILLRKIVDEVSSSPSDWKGIKFLNSANPVDWEKSLYKVISLVPGGWDSPYSQFVGFIKALTGNWTRSIPDILAELSCYKIKLDDFFKMERTVTFKLASLLNDINLIQRYILKDEKIDISPFVSKVSHAFLPVCVYQLEEYGLPRMISKKIQKSRIINFEDDSINIHDIIAEFEEVSLNGIIKSVNTLTSFDKYILEHFYSGITTR